MDTKLKENELESDRVRKLNAIIADLLARVAALELAAT